VSATWPLPSARWIRRHRHQMGNHFHAGPPRWFGARRNAVSLPLMRSNVGSESHGANGFGMGGPSRPTHVGACRVVLGGRRPDVARETP
jgi:hypothetical protein